LCDHFDANDCLFGGDDDDDDVDDGMAWRPDAPSSMHQEPHVRSTQSSARTDAPANVIKVTFHCWSVDGQVESGANIAVNSPLSEAFKVFANGKNLSSFCFTCMEKQLSGCEKPASDLVVDVCGAVAQPSAQESAAAKAAKAAELRAAEIQAKSDAAKAAKAAEIRAAEIQAKFDAEKAAKAAELQAKSNAAKAAKAAELQAKSEARIAKAKVRKDRTALQKPTGVKAKSPSKVKSPSNDAPMDASFVSVPLTPTVQAAKAPPTQPSEPTKEVEMSEKHLKRGGGSAASDADQSPKKKSGVDPVAGSPPGEGLCSGAMAAGKFLFTAIDDLEDNCDNKERSKNRTVNVKAAHAVDLDEVSAISGNTEMDQLMASQEKKVAGDDEDSGVVFQSDDEFKTGTEQCLADEQPWSCNDEAAEERQAMPPPPPKKPTARKPAAAKNEDSDGDSTASRLRRSRRKKDQQSVCSATTCDSAMCVAWLQTTTANDKQ